MRLPASLQLYGIALFALVTCMFCSTSYADSQDSNSLEAKLVDAAGHGKLDDIGRLLAAGANVNGRYYVSTPLLSAIYKKQKSSVRLLLDAGADPNLPDYSGTPLAGAITSGNDPEVVELLLSHGADPNIEYGRGRERRTPLVALANSNPYTALHNEKFIRDMKRIGIPIKLGSKANQERIAKMLIGAGAKFDLAENDCDSPLNAAIVHNNVMLAGLFLDKGANPNMIAGADCAEPGKTPLELALVHYFQYNDPTIMTLLMEHGANTNYRVDKEFIPGPPFFQDRAWNGITPLLFAVESGFVKPVQILLSHGADPCLPRTDGTLPIEIATEHHYKAIMSLLHKSMSDRHCEASVKNPDAAVQQDVN